MYSGSAVSVQVPILGVRIPDAGYVVKQLFSSIGEKAIMYMKDHKADLMVLDMIMDPAMDGLDTCKSIYATNPKQKSIIVNSFSKTDRAHAARDLGAGAYV